MIENFKNQIQLSRNTLVFFACSILLFVLSLFLPVLTKGPQSSTEPILGWVTFALWPIPVFWGSLKIRIAIAWFANPIWLLASIFHLFTFHKAALSTAIIGFLAATLFLTFDRLSFGPMGTFYLRDLGIGFYIWFMLFLSLIIFETSLIRLGHGRNLREQFGK